MTRRSRRDWFRAQVFRDRRLSDAPRVLLLLLADLADEQGCVRVYREELAERLGCYPQRVDDRVSSLRKGGWLGPVGGLSRRDRSAHRRPVLYVLTFPAEPGANDPGSAWDIAPGPAGDVADSSLPALPGTSPAYVPGSAGNVPIEPGTSAGDRPQRPAVATRLAAAGGTSTPSGVGAPPAVPGPRPAAQANPPAHGASPQSSRRSRARTDRSGPTENPRRRAAQQRSIWPAWVDPATDASGSAGAAPESHEHVVASGGDHQRAAEIRPLPPAPSALAVEAVAALDQLAHRAAAAGVEPPGRLPGAAERPAARQRPPCGRAGRERR